MHFWDHRKAELSQRKMSAMANKAGQAGGLMMEIR
jgi:hypothetical protein